METAPYKSQQFSFPANNSGTPEFAFTYPVFPNWQDINVKKIDDNNYLLEIGWSGFAEIPPMAPPEVKEPIKPPAISVRIQKIFPVPTTEVMHSAAAHTNAQGIHFRFLEDPSLKTDDQQNFIEFYPRDYAVKIETAANDYYGFSIGTFWNTISDSFSETQ